MLKIILLSLGIILTSIGLVSILLYLNLLVMGYSFLKYLLFIITNFWTLLFFIGLLLIFLGTK